MCDNLQGSGEAASMEHSLILPLLQGLAQAPKQLLSQVQGHIIDEQQSSTGMRLSRVWQLLLLLLREPVPARSCHCWPGVLSQGAQQLKQHLPAA